MTYDATKLSMVSAGPIAVGSRMWIHTSADAGAAVDTTGFISDGGKYGMKVGDLVQHTNTATNIVTLHRVMTVSATTNAVDLSDTTTIASGTNTD